MVTPEEARELADSLINGWHERKHQKAYSALIDLADQLEAMQADAARKSVAIDDALQWLDSDQELILRAAKARSALRAAINAARKDQP